MKDPQVELCRHSLSARRQARASSHAYRADVERFRSALQELAADGRHRIASSRDLLARPAIAGFVTEPGGRHRVAELKMEELRAEIELRKLRESRLFEAAFHDDMTRLHNRAFFLDRLEAALAGRHAGPAPAWAVIFLDLDRFKSINDLLGHGVGDQLLVEVAHRLAGCTRGDDVLARMGGDEFALLVAVRGAIENAVELARRIVRAFEDPFHLGEHTIRAGCSIGITPVGPDYMTVASLLHDADTAMYRAKRSGSREPALFTREADAAAAAPTSLQKDLLPGLARGEFKLLYQPIFDIATRRPSSFEVLIRWDHPVHGAIPPDLFIPLAEESGLARVIGRWVLGAALPELRAWLDGNPGEQIRLDVNVSAQELLDERFASDVARALEACGLGAGTLEIEITEGVLQARSPQVLRTLTDLRAAGIGVALDDFGTGFSSLGAIDGYPIDTLKIDRSFVERMLDQPRTCAVVRTIIDLAIALDLDVVAEGVETAAQLEALATMGCRHVQGFHLARPMAFEDALETGRQTRKPTNSRR